jgi:hypothetical protein
MFDLRRFQERLDAMKAALVPPKSVHQTVVICAFTRLTLEQMKTVQSHLDDVTRGDPLPSDEERAAFEAWDAEWEDLCRRWGFPATYRLCAQPRWRQNQQINRPL